MVSASAAFATHARPSHAAFEYQLSATGSITYTDNITNAPDDPPELGDDAAAALLTKEPGFLYTLSPGGSVSLVEPRGHVALGYSHPITYASSSLVSSSSSDAFIGSGAYELSPLDNVGLSTSVTRSSFTGLLFNNQPATTITGVNNAGTQEVLRLQAGQFWSRQWTETVSSQQSASFGSQLDLQDTELPNTRVATLAGALLLDHRYGIFGLSVSETATENSTDGGDWLHLVAANVSWNRPLDPLTTMMLNVGASKTLDNGPFQAIGGASVSRSSDFTTWSLAVNRSQAGDLQTGRVFTTDAALAGFIATPFEITPVTFAASTSASRLDSGTDLGYTLQASATISYAHRYFFSSLNYSFLRQIGDDDGPTAIPTLTRNAVMLTIGSAFPPQ